MTPEQETYMGEVLDTLEALVPGARGYLLGLVGNLAEQDINWTALIALLEQAAATGWRWETSWRRIARAWMVVHVLPMYRIYGSFPNDQDAHTQYAALIGRLEYYYDNMWVFEEDLMDDIVEELLGLASSRRHSARIVQLQVHVARNAWAPHHFTNPMQHDPMQFCYVIHAMRPLTAIPRGGQAVFEELLRTVGREYLTACVGNLNQVNLHGAALFLALPRMLCSEILSCSVIDRQHTRTYGSFSFGFILHVPSSNIIMAAHNDLQASYFQNLARPTNLAGQSLVVRVRAQNELLEGLALGMARPLASPATILRNSSNQGHNEVLVVGHNGSSRVRPRAIFIKVTSDGRLWASFMRDDEQHGLRAHILSCCQRLRIPIIPIVEDSEQPSNVTLRGWLRGVSTIERSLTFSPLENPLASSRLSLIPRRQIFRHQDHSLMLSGSSLSGMRQYTLSHRSGTTQTTLTFELPVDYTTRHVLDLFLPIFRHYRNEIVRTRRQSLLAHTRRDEEEENTLQVAVARDEPEQAEPMRQLLVFIQQLLRNAQDASDTSMASGMLSWRPSDKPPDK